MMSNWDNAFRLMLAHEGGYVNHPKDPGGVTNLGVTKRAWEAYTGRSSTDREMRSLTPAKVEPFYKSRYWDAVKADQLPPGLDFCLFDTCVNSGPSRASMLLQGSLGVVADGAIGPHTIDAVHRQGNSDLIGHYCAARLAFLKSLPTWPTFGKGWARRVREVETQARGMK